MGIVAFQWGENQLTLLQNREKMDPWATKPVAWDEENKILRGLPEDNFGTWFGISTRGRVAFLVDAMLPQNLSPSEYHHPVDFLRGEMSPMDFATKWSSGCINLNNKDLAYHMIVADLNSNSMVYTSKWSSLSSYVHTKQVGFGVHTLTSDGLDMPSPKDFYGKVLFRKLIGEYENKQVQTLKEMAVKFKYEPVDFIGDGYDTMSTTAFEVRTNKKVKLYERYLENCQWKDHDFSFNISP